MTRRSVRTYKLRLSAEGIGYFIDCHARLAKALGEMIPYGRTLCVALSILAETPASAWVDGSDERRSKRLRGDRTYYVGYSYRIAELTAAVSDARRAEGLTALPVLDLYALALECLVLADDNELRQAGERVLQNEMMSGE